MPFSLSSARSLTEGVGRTFINAGIELILKPARAALQVTHLEKGTHISSLRYDRAFAFGVLAASFFFHGLEFSLLLLQLAREDGRSR